MWVISPSTLVFNTFLDSTVGILYTSGEKGVDYTQSLDNHVAADFYRVRSMSGVYITTEKGDDNSLQTRISLDRGAQWKPIKCVNSFVMNIIIS